MKKTVVVVLFSVLLLGGLPVSAAWANPKPAKTCAVLKMTYPSGIAESAQAARRAVQQGFARPNVVAKLYSIHKKRFDKANRGFLCTSKSETPLRPQPVAPTDPFLNADAPSAPVSACRLADQRSTQQLTVGFPLPAGRLPTSSPIKVGVIYVDFPDHPAQIPASDPVRNFTRFSGESDAFHRAMSYNQTRFEWVVHPDFIRMPQPLSNYGISRRGGSFIEFMQQAITQADPVFDFSGVDMVVIALNPSVPEVLADVSPAFPMRPGAGFATAEGGILNGTLLAGDAHRIGASILIHEIGHLYGLTDLYSFNVQPGDPYEKNFEYMGHFDYMNFAPGRGREMIAWHRWLLNWVTDQQVKCVTEPGTSTHVLETITVAGNGNKLAVIPTSATQALVVESRRPNLYCEVCQSGVLAYLVDTARRTGNGPIQIVRKPGSTDPMYADAILRKGEGLRFGDVTISLVDSVGDRDLIQVTR